MKITTTITTKVTTTIVIKTMNKELTVADLQKIWDKELVSES